MVVTNIASTRRGSLVGSMSALYVSGAVIDPRVRHNLSWNFFPFANLKRAICQFLAKEWALNIGKLPLGGLLRNSVFK